MVCRLFGQRCQNWGHLGHIIRGLYRCHMRTRIIIDRSLLSKEEKKTPKRWNNLCGIPTVFWLSNRLLQYLSTFLKLANTAFNHNYFNKNCRKKKINIILSNCAFSSAIPIEKEKICTFGIDKTAITVNDTNWTIVVYFSASKRLTSCL